MPARAGSLTRAASALALARLDNGDAERFLADDPAAMSVLRAAVAPNSEADSAALMRTALAAFLTDLAPASAAAALMAQAAVRVTDGPTPLNLPVQNSSATAAWVRDLDAFPVTTAGFGLVALHRRKLAAIAAISSELMRRSTAGQVIDALLRKAAAAALDSAMFDDVAGDDDRPAGLLHGVTPTAGYGGGDFFARRTDLEALVAALSPVSTEIAFVMSPVRALSLRLDGIDLGYPLFTSAHMATDVVIALALPALAVWSGGVQIEASREAALHMRDDLGPIAPEGGPIADPVRSKFQSDTVATRLIAEVGWVSQASGGVAAITGATW